MTSRLAASRGIRWQQAVPRTSRWCQRRSREPAKNSGLLRAGRGLWDRASFSFDAPIRAVEWHASVGVGTRPGLSEAEHQVLSEVIIDEPGSVRPIVDFSTGRVYRGPESKALRMSPKRRRGRKPL